jgi:hypothetical protein
MLTILVRVKILTDTRASVASVWIRAWVTAGILFAKDGPMFEKF